MEPRLKEAISGLKRGMARSRSSADMPMPPPVVMPMITSLSALICRMISRKISGSAEGRPLRGSRACRCTAAAPARAQAMASAAICSGVIGKCGVCVGMVTEPVMAAVMMSLSNDLTSFLRQWESNRPSVLYKHRGVQPHQPAWAEPAKVRGAGRDSPSARALSFSFSLALS